MTYTVVSPWTGRFLASLDGSHTWGDVRAYLAKRYWFFRPGLRFRMIGANTGIVSLFEWPLAEVYQ